MSLDVFLSFRRCPKHPNTPPFHFGNPRLREITGDYGRLREIEWRLKGAYTE